MFIYIYAQVYIGIGILYVNKSRSIETTAADGRKGFRQKIRRRRRRRPSIPREAAQSSVTRTHSRTSNSDVDKS